MNGSADDDMATRTSSSKRPIHDVETSITPVTSDQRGRGSKPPMQAPSLSGTSTTVGSPLEALERDEILRTRWFCLIAAGVSISTAAAIPILPGNIIAGRILLGAVMATLVATVVVYRNTTDPVRFQHPSTSIGRIIPACAVTTSIPYFGVFSPACMVLVLGIYFTCLGNSSRMSNAVFAICAGMQAIVGSLVIAGVIPDTGIVRPEHLSTEYQIIVQLLIQMVLVATFITARMSNRTALVAVGELERAVRLAAHREALLLEAREELERARSGRGRFSQQVIGGYTLGNVIGRGAMGEVYAASRPDDKPVAIKILSQASLGNPNHVLRFLRELRTVAGVRAPNIVEVIEVGEDPLPYLVMERLEGQTLSEVLRSRRGLSQPELVEMITQVGNGITAAYAAGIVHRDLKPQNIFKHHDTWKILDFGVARAMDGGDTLTAGQIVGTPSYMAPEQASGGTVDHGTDLYALAAIAYRALTGHPPFSAGEIAETLYRVVHTKPRRPSDLTDVPPEIDLVLAIGMAKNAAQRFRNAAELAAALESAFAHTLPETLLERGRLLEKQGVWSGVPTRASTSRIRVPR